MSTTTVRADEPLYGATPAQALRRFLHRYAVFSGRASRSEFWWTYLFLILAVLALGIVGTLLGVVTATPADRAEGDAGVGVVFAPITILLLVLGVIVPLVALVVRRLHDANLSGLLALIWLVPYLGGLVVLILCVLPTSPLGRRFDRDAQGWTGGVAPASGEFGPSPYGQPVQPAPPQSIQAGGQEYTVRPLPVDPASAPAVEVADAVRALQGGDRAAVDRLADRMRAVVARTEHDDLLIVADGRVEVRYDDTGRIAGVEVVGRRG